MQAPLQARNDSDAAQMDTARTVAQKRVLADNRPEALAQRKLAEMMNNSPRVLQKRVLADNRPEALAQRKLAEIMYNSPRMLQQRALSNAIHNSPRMVTQHHEMNALFGGAVRPQRGDAISAELSLAQREEKPNHTGLPDQLMSGIESLSGMNMDHVKVHYNSDKPAQLQAHAYAEGSEIHLGAGQERHLPHEAWHVVQQAQGRVRPTLQMKAGAVNDDPSLEKEADMMGEKAAQFKSDYDARNLVAEKRVAAVTVQRVTGFRQNSLSLSGGQSIIQMVHASFSPASYVGATSHQDLAMYARAVFGRDLPPLVPHSQILRENLVFGGVPDSHNSAVPIANQAHHIVELNDIHAAPARMLLALAGIELNSAINGVLLPAENTDETGEATIHVGSHVRAYAEQVNAALDNTIDTDPIFIAAGQTAAALRGGGAVLLAANVAHLRTILSNKLSNIRDLLLTSHLPINQGSKVDQEYDPNEDRRSGGKKDKSGSSGGQSLGKYFRDAGLI